MDDGAGSDAFTATGLTLMWVAIEKWGYPNWRYPLLSANPRLLMGMTPGFYMVLAGYVEFFTVFLLLSAP